MRNGGEVAVLVLGSVSAFIFLCCGKVFMLFPLGGYKVLMVHIPFSTPNLF